MESRSHAFMRTLAYACVLSELQLWFSREAVRARARLRPNKFTHAHHADPHTPCEYKAHIHATQTHIHTYPHTHAPTRAPQHIANEYQRCFDGTLTPEMLEEKEQALESLHDLVDIIDNAQGM